METPIQVFGVFEKPLNPMALAIALDVTFVARVFCADVEGTREVMKKAITHKGFALVDIFQPCVSFNKINTFKWFKDNTAYLPDGYDASDRAAAFKKSLEEEPFPLGILYQSDRRVTFEDNLEVYKRDRTPLHRRVVDMQKVEAEIMANV